MSEWQPIETAPKDETVILSDCGTIRWDEDTRPPRRWHGLASGWFLCDAEGMIPCDGEDGYEISEMNPKRWMSWPPSELQQTNVRGN